MGTLTLPIKSLKDTFAFAVAGVLCRSWRQGWAPAAQLRLWQHVGHGAECGEDGSVLLLCC